MATPRVLVVDDDPAVAATLERVLRADGYAVDVAHRGHAALRLAEKRRPDLTSPPRGPAGGLGRGVPALRRRALLWLLAGRRARLAFPGSMEATWRDELNTRPLPVEEASVFDRPPLPRTSVTAPTIATAQTGAIVITNGRSVSLAE